MKNKALLISGLAIAAGLFVFWRVRESNVEKARRLGIGGSNEAGTLALKPSSGWSAENQPPSAAQQPAFGDAVWSALQGIQVAEGAAPAGGIFGDAVGNALAGMQAEALNVGVL